MAKSPFVVREEGIVKHVGRIRKIQEWLDEYKNSVNEADALNRWSEGSWPSVPVDAVEHAIKFMEKDAGQFLKNLDQFIVEAKAES